MCSHMSVWCGINDISIGLSGCNVFSTQTSFDRVVGLWGMVQSTKILRTAHFTLRATRLPMWLPAESTTEDIDSARWKSLSFHVLYTRHFDIVLVCGVLAPPILHTEPIAHTILTVVLGKRHMVDASSFQVLCWEGQRCGP